MSRLYIKYKGNKLYFEDSFRGFKTCQFVSEALKIKKCTIYHEKKRR